MRISYIKIKNFLRYLFFTILKQLYHYPIQTFRFFGKLGIKRDKCLIILSARGMQAIGKI